MLDAKLIRSDPDGVRTALERRGGDAAAGVDRFLELDGERRELLQQVETARAERNAAARAIAEAKGRGEDAAAEIARQSELKRSQSEGEEALARIEAAISDVMAALPNPPHPSAPVGDSEDDAEVVRVHQFDKLELFSYCHPDRSWDEQESLLVIEEEIAQELGFHYRVVNVAAGDLGASAARKFDIEVWLPGQERYRELTSCSNTTDFQARRLDVRYRPEPSARPVHVATLNGTAAAVGRTIIALLENGQQDDGSVRMPAALVAHGAPEVLAPAPGRVASKMR